MNWILKTFNDLTIDELYALLQLRVEVFVVEQNCPYKEIDNNDQVAVHLMGYQSGCLIAYSRLFKPGDYYDEASIGRVIVKKDFRTYGYGAQLIEQSIKQLEELAPHATIKIQAQHYLHQFYESFGFQRISEIYEEDGIPHIDMIKTSNQLEKEVNTPHANS
ncbi:GNAT family N-acetyltransferase [Alkalihalophilus sp. As8PL]|uniref:GNAT family N-acetyltransferase n=1 Tax=Alkalihalophilus sp. As8PL TaxID=3237103 RepID=A0AB39BRR9_9BACI